MNNPSDALRVVVGLAEKATPYHWQAIDRGLAAEVCCVGSCGDTSFGFSTPGYPGGNYRDAEFAACADDVAAVVAAVNFIREHGAALAQALENDARYRWLRDEAQNAGRDPFIAQRSSYGLTQWSGDKADAAIDSAIAAQQKEEGK